MREPWSRSTKKLPEEQWPESKVCYYCETEKSLEAFYKKSNGLYGRMARCKPCASAYQKSKYDPDVNSERCLAWKSANPDYGKEYAKIWRLENPDYGKEYNQRNLERYALHAHNRRARLAGLEGEITEEQWEFLLAFCGRCCVGCGIHEDALSEAMHKDHIIPITVDGSSNWIWNLQPLCKSCNSSKRNLNSIDYRPDAIRMLIEEYFKLETAA